MDTSWLSKYRTGYADLDEQMALLEDDYRHACDHFLKTGNPASYQRTDEIATAHLTLYMKGFDRRSRRTLLAFLAVAVAAFILSVVL